jgi:hypothetical protein
MAVLKNIAKSNGNWEDIDFAHEINKSFLFTEACTVKDHHK